MMHASILRWMGTIGLAWCLPALSGCGNATTGGPAAEQEAVPTELAAVFRAVPAPAEHVGIPALRRVAQPGRTVVVEARIMGSKSPFVDGRAAFIIGDDATLTSCDERPGETCATPWDNCCDPPQLLRAGTATVQVVDESGRVIRHGLRTVGGLKELSRLRVAGVVAPRSTEDVFIINATAIQVR